jgi:hypothetical protein
MQRLKGELGIDIFGIAEHSVTVSIRQWIRFVLQMGVHVFFKLSVSFQLQRNIATSNCHFTVPSKRVHLDAATKRKAVMHAAE